MKHATKILLVAIIISVVVFSTNMIAQTWTQLNGPYRANVRDLAIGRATGASAATLYDAEASAIYKTTNGAGTWGAVSSLGGDPLVVTCKPEDPTVVLGGIEGYLMRSSNSGSSWVVRVEDPNLYPLSLATSQANSEKMYLGLQKAHATSSMQRCPNGGTTWYPIDYFYGGVNTSITSIAPHPSDGQKVWAGGTTPSQQGRDNGEGEQEEESFQYNYTNGVFFSTDAGATWSNSGELNLNVPVLAVYTANSITYLFAGTDDSEHKLYKTTDNGSNWTEVTSYEHGLINDIKVDQNNVIYVAANDGIYRSTDNGSNWVASNSGLYDASDIKRIAIDPQNASYVFAGSPTTVYKSTDGGASWQDAATGITHMSISAIGNCDVNILANPTDQSIVEKYDGSSWQTNIIGSQGVFSGKMVGFKTSSCETAFLAGYRQGSGSNTVASMWRSTNGGSSPWTEVYKGASNSGRYDGFVVDPRNADRVYIFGKISTDTNVCLSISGGTNWGSVSIPSTNSSNVPEITDLVVDSTNGSTYSYTWYAASNSTSTDKGGVWKTSNAGSSWSQTSLTSPVVSLGLNPNTPSVIYAALGSSGMEKTTNGGSTWTTISNFSMDVSRILIHPSYPSSSDNALIVTNSKHKIYKTTDGFSSWDSLNCSNLPRPIYDLRAAPITGYIFASTSGGIFKYDVPPIPINTLSWVEYDQCGDGKKHPKLTWSIGVQEMDLKEIQIYRKKYNESSYTLKATVSKTAAEYIDTSIAVYYQCPSCSQADSVRYYVSKVDSGLNQAPSNITAVPVAYQENQGKTIPILDPATIDKPPSYELHANYPNPFNPTTTIKYALPEDVHVTLKVYDVLGREVATLVDEYQKANWYEIKFNANRLPSGVYFYKFNAGKFSKVSKMLLAK